MIHVLKTDSDVFKAVVSGDKTFEIRKDDRNFQVGDLLDLRETIYSGESMQRGAPLKYTGSTHVVRIGYIMRGPIYGLADGWCIMSIAS